MFIQIEDKEGKKHYVNINQIEYVKECDDGTAEIDFADGFLYTMDRYKMVIADIFRAQKEGNK